MSSYFYLDSHHTQCGPISPEHFAEHGVTPQTLVWCSGMDNWTPASQVPELQSFFASQPGPGMPPPPPPGSYANPTDTAASPDSSATGSSTYGGIRRLLIPDNSLTQVIHRCPAPKPIW